MLIVLNSTLVPDDLRGKIEDKAIQLIVREGSFEIEWRESKDGHMIVSHQGYRANVAGAEGEHSEATGTDLMRAHDTELLAYLDQLKRVHS